MSLETNTKIRATHLIAFYHTKNFTENSEYNIYHYEKLNSKIHSVTSFINTAMQKCIADVKK
jgi:hypothetical protein